MAICKKCKCNTKYCGCADKAILASPPCGQDTLYCPTPEPCAETFSTNCVVYTGDSIVNLDINKGDRMDDVIQKLVLALTGGCIATGGCESPIGLKTTYISQTIVKIAWDLSNNSAQYNVEWKLSTSLAWTNVSAAITPSPTPEYTVTGLLPNTTYYLRVKSTCTAVPPNPAAVCYSVIISFTTLDN